MFEYVPDVQLDPIDKWLLETKSRPVVILLVLSLVNQHEVLFRSKAVTFRGHITGINTTDDQFILAVELDHFFRFTLNLRSLDDWEITQP